MKRDRDHGLLLQRCVSRTYFIAIILRHPTPLPPARPPPPRRLLAVVSALQLSHVTWSLAPSLIGRRQISYGHLCSKLSGKIYFAVVRNLRRMSYRWLTNTIVQMNFWAFLYYL